MGSDIWIGDIGYGMRDRLFRIKNIGLGSCELRLVIGFGIGNVRFGLSNY